MVEGDAKARTVLLPVTLSEPATGTVHIDYVLAGVDATPGGAKTPNVDFNDKAGKTKTLTFKAGQVAKTVGVHVYADTVAEPTETFTLTLSNPTGGATLGNAVGTGTILDDDVAPGPRMAIGDASIIEGNLTKRPVKFRVTLSEPATAEVDVDCTIVPVTATGDYKHGTVPAGTDLRDFLGQTKTLRFKPSAHTGKTGVQKAVSVLTYPDTTPEGTETFQVVLSNLQGPATLTRDIGTGTVTDDDGPVTTAWAWGLDSAGQLANPSTIGNPQRTPNEIGADTDWSSISAGSSHTVAVKTDGTLWAWGSDNQGALGDATTTDRSTPMQTGTDTNWASVAGGNSYSVGVKTDGTLWAWGSNNYGQLGDGTTTEEHTPTQIGADTDWASIASGGTYTVALKTDGTLWAWGNNSAGALGDGTTTDQHAPVRIGTDTDWATISASGATAALKTDGTLWTWGYNGQGQLGDGTTTSRSTPAQVGTDADWSTVRATYLSMVALKADGTIWTWGHNGTGQLGDGTTTQRDVPGQVGTDTDWTTISGGSGFTTAVKTDGTLWAWGWNYFGQLGDGTATDEHTPSQVGTDTDWTAVDARSEFSVATKSDGSVWAWGSNSAGQLGAASIADSPAQVDNSHWGTISAGSNFTVAIKTDGSLWAWGDNGQGQLGDGTTSYRDLPTQVGTDTDWTSVDAGSNFTVAIRSDGTLWAWGAGGMVGDGTTTGHSSPTQIGTDTDWASVDAGPDHTNAIKSDGTLWGWGTSDYGQVGDGSSGGGPRLSPVQDGTDTDWASVSAGTKFSAALKTDGTLWSWGLNSVGQLGGGSNYYIPNPTPSQRVAGTDWTAVSAGGSHAVALRSDGTVWTWGSNASGELGNGYSGGYSPSPIQLGSDTDWATLGAGDAHSVGIKLDGTLWAWGANSSGQIGDGTTTGPRTPTEIGADTDWDSVSAGSQHTVALRG